jgi:hypothetical protein
MELVISAMTVVKTYVVTVIQIMSMTEGTSLLEQSSLSFHCHICCFVQEEINSSLK